MSPLQVARFWSQVKVLDRHECWPWRSSTYADSDYGRFNIGETSTGSHRVAWSLAAEREIPEGLHVLHSCDNPPCCNPGHLRLGTQQNNTDDMMERGRHRALRGADHPNSGVTTHQGEDTPTSKLTLEEAKGIIDLYQTGLYSQRDLGKRFGISQAQVSKIVTGKHWSHL